MKRAAKSAKADRLIAKSKRIKTKSNLVSASHSTRVTKKLKSHKSNVHTDLSKLSVDDFMNCDFEGDSDSNDEKSIDGSHCRVSNGHGYAVNEEESINDISDDDGEELEGDSDSDVGNKMPRQVNGFLDAEAEEGEEPMDDDTDNDEADDEEDYEEAESGADFIDNEAREENKWQNENEEDSCDEQDSEGEDNRKDYADLPDDEGDMHNGEDEMSAAGHKKSLQKLQQTDPEFFKFLEENDKKLLQFDVSDSDSEDEEDKIHKPDENLEVASEDSDNEDEPDIKVEEGVITLKMVREWQQLIQTDKSLATIADVVSAFHAAMIRVTSVEEPCKFKVDGSAVFNGVVQLCVMQLQPAFKRFLRLPPGSEGKNIQLKKCKKWKKVKPQLKLYILNLFKLLGGVSSAPIVSVLLKHLHQMTPFVACFSLIARKIVKHLITVWGSAEDTTRVIAFLCILRITNTDRTMLDSVLKQMYLNYVNNCKFTSPSTLAGINFMRHCLVELFSLDEASSYQHVFLYIRQLAIHLRNAITLQKKEAMQSVLNWQFVHSIHLWSDLLAENKPTLQPLLYPLVQIMIGTVKLIPTTQYFPLRFHLTEMMTDLSRRTNTFIPILPLLLEVLTSFDINRRNKKASMKPMNLACVLRVSKSEQSEVSFKDAIVELVYQRMLQYLAQEAHCIGFPDIAVPALMQLRKFLKSCKVANYCKLIKSLVDKAEENSRWIEKARKTSTLVLSDRKAVDAWETDARIRGPPLVAFYNNFQTVNMRKMAKRITDNEKLGDQYNIPTIKKRAKKELIGDEKVVLFPSDDEEESENEPSTSKDAPLPAKKKKKKKKKKAQIKMLAHEAEDGTEEDIIQEFKMEDF